MKIPYAFLLTAFAAGQISAAEITVSAAASLKDAFNDIITHYHKQYPQSKIKLNTAGSGFCCNRQCGVRRWMYWLLPMK
ncbi:hypothetical protein [Neisseria weixii]|uniref:hypothetical protein n=1 Tax=Neisseria weixii TaxID=1853276 RepID=UPI002FC77A50